ncbi:MAG: hypothetical protein LUD68_01210 [Rikenellaceae bacterium]|nr:hypothetical protein [Rikenellaceae bacterium]
MRNTKQYQLLAAVGCLLLGSGCSTDFMENKGNYGSFTEDLFGNEALATQVLNNVYGYQQNGLSSPPANRPAGT